MPDLTQRIRTQFPALERRHAGLPVAYFDGPGGTQVPRPVVDAIADYLLRHNANTHWVYPTSVETDEMILAARATLADLVGGAPGEIVFGANMTTLTFHLARGLGRDWGPEDEIVVTELDHRANVDPWLALAKERGVTVRMVKANLGTGELDWDDFERQVTARTRLVAVGAASNALGTITDVRRAAERAHAVGALCFVDAVHYAPHTLVDVAALGCDFLACSAYKFYGPHVGILWGRRDHLERVDTPKLLPAPDEAPDRLETGTGNFEGLMGAAAAVDFLASLGHGPSRRDRLRSSFERLHAEGSALVRRLWDGLGEVPGVKRYGPPPGRPRTPTVSFAFDGVSSVEIARALAGRALFVSNGDFYASTIVGRLGHAEDGLVRVGCACYTTADEVERLLEAVRELRPVPA